MATSGASPHVQPMSSDPGSAKEALNRITFHRIHSIVSQEWCRHDLDHYKPDFTQKRRSGLLVDF
jgi:hypothetical protein